VWHDSHSKGSIWSRMGILHIGSASGTLALHEVRGVRVDKKVEVVRGRRSYAEVLGLLSQPEVECFNSYS
jgi:hypothetical protein